VNVPNALFVTGSDTGVGKTVVSGLLLSALRRLERPAFGFKPFASGSRTDARHLNRFHCPGLPLDAVNPFHFRRPLAPLAAARLEGRHVQLDEARAALARAYQPGRTLVVEGCGGLLVPLGAGFTLLDLLPDTGAAVVVVAANRLGVLNHTLLTVHRIQSIVDLPIRVALVDITPRGDRSRRSNRTILAELLAPLPVVPIPFLRRLPWQAGFAWTPRLWQAAGRLLAWPEYSRGDRCQDLTRPGPRQSIQGKQVVRRQAHVAVVAVRSGTPDRHVDPPAGQASRRENQQPIAAGTQADPPWHR
jgi:dethiobiotin synthetase